MSSTLTLNEEAILSRLAESEELLMNALLGRKSWLERLSPGSVNKIDIDKEMGYPADISIYDMRTMYERFPISNRVVEVLPLETWRSNPTLVQGDPDEEGPFEKAWADLTSNLLGSSRFRNVRQGNPIWEVLKRLDIARGIGEYGILFFGVDDGKPLDTPLVKKEGMKLKFLRVFDQTCVDIVQWDEKPTSERYCHPEIYEIEFSDPDGRQELGIGSKKHRVHHSRVLHVADNILSNELFGLPRQKPVWNRICDLRMLYGGSAMMLWKGGFPGISIETHPSLGIPTLDEEEKSALSKAIDNYQNGLQRYLALQGMAARSLSPQVADPSKHIEVQIDAICIEIPIPKRIFMGSERGELSSAQDTDNWNSFVQGRQNNNATPTLVVPFVDKLISIGVLPEPDEYDVEWEPIDAQTEDEKASVAIKRIHALTKYVAGDVETVMSPTDMYVRLLGFSKKEAQAILKAAVDSFEDSEDRDLDRQIKEAQLLRKHKSPMLSDEEKSTLLDLPSETEEQVEKEAKSDKFTQGSEGNKKLRKLTSTRVPDADDTEGADEGEDPVA